MITPRVIRSTAAAALIAIVAGFGCHHEQRAQTRNEPHLIPLRIELLPVLSFAPLAIANDEGFFRQEGIEPKMLNIGIREAVPALIANRIDVLAGPMRSGMFAIMSQAKNNQTLQIVADKGHIGGDCVSDAIVARSGVMDRVARNDYRGLRVMAGKASVYDYFNDLFVQRRHIDFTAVVSQPGTTEGMISSLQDGSLDVRYVSEPALSTIVERKIGTIIATGQELEPGLQLSVIVFGQTILRDNPDLGKRFMRAYLRGVHQYNQGKTDRNIAIVSRLTHLTPTEIKRTCWIPITEDGAVNVASVERFIAWSRARRYLDADVPTAVWWNPSFIEAARQAPAASAAVAH